MTPPPLGIHSFVWVKSPNSSMQHQAELLEIREEGYLVRWTLCNKEELISPACVLEQELPSRRRSSSLHAAAIATTSSSSSGNGSDEKTTRGEGGKDQNPEQEQREHEHEQDGDDKANQKQSAMKKGMNERSDSASSSRATHKANSSKKRPSRSSLHSNKENHKGNAKHAKTQYPSLATETATATTKTTTTRPNWPAAAINNSNNSSTTVVSLWKVHRLPKSTSEARVAQLLHPHGLDQASNVVSNLFLFAFERQSCWQRRNNEENPIWSQSPVLQNYSFANVYRELDRGTCFLRSHFGDLYIRQFDKNNTSNSNSNDTNNHNHNHNHNNSNNKRKKKNKKVRRRDWIQKLLWASYCYRQVNRIEPFLTFGGIPTMEEANCFLDFVARIQRDEGDKDFMFFNVSTYPSTPAFDDYVFHLRRLQEANGWLLKSIAGRLAQCKTVRQCWEQISKRLPGLSTAKQPSSSSSSLSPETGERNGTHNNNHNQMEHYGDAIAWQVLCDLLESGCLQVSLYDHYDMDMCYLEPKSIKTLSACWKDRQVDETRSLELLRVLVDRQADIFAAIGVEFPKWDNRPLSIKDIAHCLAQYSKYLEIQKDLSRQTIGAGHPLLASRSYMDVSKTCRYCDAQTDEGLFCDACLCFYCSNCERKNCAAPPKHWICSPCRELDRMEFLD